MRRCLVALVLAAACGHTTTHGASSDGGTGDGNDGGTAPPPHVIVKDGALQIDGAPTFLYGGDLHYFRVRDPNFDAAATQAMWSATIDQMRAAGMNLVTTYVPWDYHNTADGTWDFAGAKDLGAFLKLACGKSMYVVLKPGPLITAEWPDGFGTFGAVPAWWKTAHPDSLVHDAKGDLWTYSLTGDTTQRQPSFLDPTYLAAVQDYYTHVFAIAAPYLGNCVIGVQVDNETNGYWSERYGDVDYSPVSVAHFRSWLQTKYGTIDALNAAWSSAFASFDVVTPPQSSPSSSQSDRPNNKSYADWYAGGQAYSLDYLKTLRTMMEGLGVTEPNIVFLTNDSPFALEVAGIRVHNVLLADGTIKDQVGYQGLDLYPKQSTLNDDLQDQPFQADFFTTLYDHWSARVRGTGGFAYAAELQGGFYSAPIVGRPDVRPEATDQLLARSIGRGLKSGSFYVIRDGLNADNSSYAYAAPLDVNGTPTTRYPVVAKWGKLLAAYAPSLLRTQPVRNSIAILVDGRYQAPQGGVLDDLQLSWANEAPALFGWLAHAGYDPAVLDARGLTAADLAGYKQVFFLDPDFVYDDTAQLLVDYAHGGGVLVDLLWPGRVSDGFVASAPTTALSTEVFSAVYANDYVWANVSRDGTCNLSYPNSAAEATTYWYESFWSQPASGALEPFAYERQEPLGGNGGILGYVDHSGGMTRAFLGTSVWSVFDQNGYYEMSDADLASARSMASYLVGLSGEQPVVSTTLDRGLVWARRDGATVWLFVINDDASAQAVTVTVNQPALLGLTAGVSFTYQDVLNGGTSAIAVDSFTLQLPAWGTAVVKVSP